MQNSIQTDRKSNVVFKRRYDIKEIKKIAKASGSSSLIKETVYLEKARFYAKDKFICEMLADMGFYAGTIGKNHFRLIEIAVQKKHQSKGYGRIMMWKIIRMCKKYKLKKITLRTNKNEKAVHFYKKFGGKIVGTNGSDYEMEIPICFT